MTSKIQLSISEEFNRTKPNNKPNMENDDTIKTHRNELKTRLFSKIINDMSKTLVILGFKVFSPVIFDSILLSVIMILNRIKIPSKVINFKECL